MMSSKALEAFCTVICPPSSARSENSNCTCGTLWGLNGLKPAMLFRTTVREEESTDRYMTIRDWLSSSVKPYLEFGSRPCWFTVRESCCFTPRALNSRTFSVFSSRACTKKCRLFAKNSPSAMLLTEPIFRSHSIIPVVLIFVNQVSVALSGSTRVVITTGRLLKSVATSVAVTSALVWVKRNDHATFLSETFMSKAPFFFSGLLPRM
mmetsp:Transcript_3428/g.10409  ORF Transcript_3428/g.10409 Transcript_3428/m.10409 type:complete len:208 (+) Transcript_3428:700-1323(+)